MQALTNRSKQVDRRKMNFFEKLYLIAIFKGMLITFMHMFKKKPTINYPEKTDKEVCRDQILVLAKLIGAGSRLVDSIFSSYEK